MTSGFFLLADGRGYPNLSEVFWLLVALRILPILADCGLFVGGDVTNLRPVFPLLQVATCYVVYHCVYKFT
jgi:hypothetical protein